VQVLTFDFHNTLANCDPWFELETRDLPWAVIEHLELRSPRVEKLTIDQAYRQLRLDVIASGNEIDAYDSVERVLEHYEVQASRQDIGNAVDHLMHESLDAMLPVPGAVDTVKFLHAEGVRMGVVSSAVHHLTLEWILDRLDLHSRFDAVITSASCGFYKSTPGIYTHALEILGGEPSMSVHVGDSLKWDVDTAQQAGVTAVWLQTGRREVFASDYQGVKPELTLQSLHGAGPILADLLGQVRSVVDA
jgi:HAD superfamily hydrolase (TIGR01549 family)